MSAPFKGGVEPNPYYLFGEPFSGYPAAEDKNIGIKVTSALYGCVEVKNKRCPYAFYFIGNNTHTLAGAANQNS